ncbi:MAG: SCO family protein [Alphaproteobacteria bacterium]|nr:SCO family protein [Alphaproteobacteria bacterium]
MSRIALIRTIMMVAIGVAIALAIGLVVRAITVDPKTGGGRDASVTGTSLVGGPFELTDQDGRRVSDQQFRGKLMLVYFGYTFCPDVCPTTLLDMSQAMDALGPAGDQVQPIFVTVDPERDTPEELKKFLANFHPRTLGLTGSPAEVQAAAKAYRVYYAKAKGAERDYLMDHTSIVYLMDRQGKYLTHFTSSIRGEQMAEAIKKFL